MPVPKADNPHPHGMWVMEKANMMKPVAMPRGGIMILRSEVGCFPARMRSMISVRPAIADTIIEPVWIICVDNSTASCPRFSGMDALIFKDECIGVSLGKAYLRRETSLCRKNRAPAVFTCFHRTAKYGSLQIKNGEKYRREIIRFWTLK